MSFNNFNKNILNLCLVISFSFTSPISFSHNVPYLDLTDMKKQIEVKDKNFYQKPSFDNEGFTYGDVYNNGELGNGKSKNQRNTRFFQKEETLKRNERSDGSYLPQRKKFLTEESLNHSHLIMSAKQGVGYVETPKFISIRKEKTLSQASQEEEKNRKLYENRSQANESTYGQRLQKHSQKRVILLLQSQDRKNTHQDSTYVEIDRDMTLPPSPYKSLDIINIDKNKVHTYK